MFILQVPPTSLLIKWQQKTSAGQTLSRTLCLHIYGGGNVYLDRDMKNQGSSAHHGSLECRLALNQIAPLIIAANSRGSASKDEMPQKKMK